MCISLETQYVHTTKVGQSIAMTLCSLKQ